jgi:hypothetical protein
MDDLELPQGTAYSYVNQLVHTSVVNVTGNEWAASKLGK